MAARMSASDTVTSYHLGPSLNFWPFFCMKMDDRLSAKIPDLAPAWRLQLTGWANLTVKKILTFSRQKFGDC